jgi:hypothetical protein
MSRFLFFTSVPLFLAGIWTAVAASPQSARPTVEWKKTVIDKTFRAEGVAVADVNRDGKLDILAGEVWYEAPDWKMHEIRKPGNYGDGAHGYSKCFASWTQDLNGDGWPDLIVIDMPGTPCHWYENPQGKDEHWKEHRICSSACNETPLYADLFGDGRRVLIMGTQPPGKEHAGQMCWFQAGKDPGQPWEKHAISEPSSSGHEIPGTFKFDHGLGVGDINGDGRLDVMTTAGWWEQPVAVERDKPWKFHPAKLSEPCADMFAYDMDGDGKADVISSSAHQYGIWWHQQKPGADGDPSFLKHDLFPKLVSQTHALHFVDINGDGLKDLVTGKRFWAHGPSGDADPGAPPKLYWFEAQRGRDGLSKFVPHEIDDNSGIGTQFVVTDTNGDGRPDIVVANKRGVFLFEQK